MTRRDEITAISEYYNIPLRLASVRRDFISEKEMSDIAAWWLEKKEQE